MYTVQTEPLEEPTSILSSPEYPTINLNFNISSYTYTFIEKAKIPYFSVHLHFNKQPFALCGLISKLLVKVSTAYLRVYRYGNFF